MGEYSKAEPLYRQAMEIYKKVLGEEHPSYATSLNNLALLYHRMGEYAKAEPLFRQAMQITKKMLGEEHRQHATVLKNLAGLLAATGRREQAWESLVQATQIDARLVSELLAVTAEQRHPAIVANWRPHFEGLVSLAAQSPEVLQHPAPRLLASTLDWKASSGRAMQARLEALALGGDAQATKLYDQLRSARRQIADLLFRTPPPDQAQQERDRIRRLEEQRDRLEEELARRVDAYAAVKRRSEAGPAQLAAQLDPGTVLVELVKYDDFDFAAKGGGRWGAAQYAAIVLARADQGTQKPGFSKKPGFSVGAPAGEPIVRFVPLGEAAPIDQAVHLWRAGVQAGRIDGGAERELIRRLWEPIAAALPAGTNRLHIAPDGELALLPLEALRPVGDRFLVEQYTIDYISHGRNLIPLPELPGEPGPALVLADPDYDSLQGDAPQPPPGSSLLAASVPSSRLSRDLTELGGPRGLKLDPLTDTAAAKAAQPDRPPTVAELLARHKVPRLPGFAREADAVTRALRRYRPDWAVKEFSGAAADEAALRRYPRPRLLYLITHGFFQAALKPQYRNGRDRGLELVGTGLDRLPAPLYREDPRLRSGLVLAGANRFAERSKRNLSDGVFTALEVQNLDLWGTELVVLSACETGMGEVQVGEGVLGLRRAFQHAGAKTVLASLWKVPDAETERLMTRFFELWLSGTPKSQALRTAQLELIAELRRSSDPARRSAPPRLWAGFICHGEPQ